MWLKTSNLNIFSHLVLFKSYIFFSSNHSYRRAEMITVEHQVQSKWRRPTKVIHQLD